MAYRIAICDDEVYQVKINQLYLKEISSNNNYDFEYIGFDNGNKLLAYLEHNSIEILFLDIDLGKKSGIMVAAEITEKYPDIVIIFITGHREFANEAFEVDAMGYVVKPVDIKKLERALKKALLQVKAIKSKNEDRMLIITEENIKKKVNEEDIVYIQRQQAKSVIYTRKKKYQVYETITSLHNRMGKNFMRVNQSEVVNTKDVDMIKDDCVILKNGISMPIGRTYRKSIMSEYFSERS